MNYAELLQLALPETIIVLAALAVLLIDFVAVRDQPMIYRKGVVAGFACFGCVAAIGLMVALPHHGRILDGMLVVDPLSQLVKIVLLVLTIFTVLISFQSDFTEHVGEYFALLLLATVGMMLLVSAENLLMVFVSLELTSLSLYILTAFNKRNINSAEAALKYFLFGGMAAAFMLFGLSLIYGLSGEIGLRAAAAKLQWLTADPLFLMALVLTVIGFGFKIAAVPFHLWAPDAYQGAPIPSAAFIASGSKVASFVVLAKVLLLGFAGAEGRRAMGDFTPGWLSVLSVLALLSVIIGNVAAIAQRSVRRLLAYSAIAHAGYMLLAIMASGYPATRHDGLAALIYYATTYALTTIGAFAVVGLVEETAGEEKFSAFAGLSKRAPTASFCMMIFLLSLAGIPPLAGFFGKFYIFTAAVGAGSNYGFLLLVIVAIAMSAVSLYYYLQVLKQIYVVETPAAATDRPGLTPVNVAIVLLAVAVVVLGCVPGLLLDKIGAALSASGF